MLTADGCVTTASSRVEVVVVVVGVVHEVMTRAETAKTGARIVSFFIVYLWMCSTHHSAQPLSLAVLNTNFLHSTHWSFF